MNCPVCAAPALRFERACAFCGSPLETDSGGAGLLDYVAEHVPGAKSRRGLFGRGPVRRLRLVAGGETFSARLRKGELELEPDLPQAAWAHELVTRLAAQATADHELRHALARSGWTLR